MESANWKTLLMQGNEFFQQQQWLFAELRYIEAYELLSHQFNQELASYSTMMAWICASHNLASLHEATGNYDNALRYLLTPHEFLVRLCESDEVSADVKENLVKGFSVTVPAIRLFSEDHNMCDACRLKHSVFVEYDSPQIKQTH